MISQEKFDQLNFNGNDEIRVRVWHRQAIYDTFKMFRNSDRVICRHYEYFKMLLDAYRHFIDDDHEIILENADDYFAHPVDFKQVAKKYDKKFSRERKIDPFLSLKAPPKKNKWITTSVIERKHWPSNDNPELETKGFHFPDGELFESFLSNQPNFYNLGDSRTFENSDELIEKMQIARDSRIYIGSCCAWSNWTSENGVPTYIMFNALTGSEHHQETMVKDILPNLRHGYTKAIVR